MSNRFTLVDPDVKTALVDQNNIALVDDNRKMSILKELVEFDGSLNLAFEFTVNTANTSAGSTTSTQFKPPTTTFGSYNCTIQWGDDSSDLITAYDQAELTHTYSTSGVYNISITGTFSDWSFNNGGDKLKITSLTNWGLNVLGLISSGAFYGCSNMTITAAAGQSPNITNANAGYNMFKACSSITAILGFEDWDISMLTTMQEFFGNCTGVNPLMTNLDTSSLTRWDYFIYNSQFNQPINHLDTSGITRWSYMLFNTPFDQSLAGLDVTAMTQATGFLQNSTLSTANYDATLIDWASQAVNSGVSIHFGNSQYSAGAAATARAALVSAGWTITDGGQV